MILQFYQLATASLKEIQQLQLQIQLCKQLKQDQITNNQPVLIIIAALSITLITYSQLDNYYHTAVPSTAFMFIYIIVSYNHNFCHYYVYTSTQNSTVAQV